MAEWSIEEVQKRWPAGLNWERLRGVECRNIPVPHDEIWQIGGWRMLCICAEDYDTEDLLHAPTDIHAALTALAEAEGERERLDRRLQIWQKVARRQREKAQHNFVWGQQWQEYYRQEEALLHEVLAAQAVAPIPEGN